MTLMAATLAGICSLACQSESPLEGDEQDLADLLELRLERITGSTDAPWVLGRISEAKTYVTRLGSYIDFDTGQLHETPESRNARFVRGRMEIVEVIQGTPSPTPWEYTWELAMDYGGSRRRGPWVGHAVFEHQSSLVLCGVHPELEGKSRFDPVFRVPIPVQSSWAAALACLRERAHLFKAGEAPGHRDALVGLLGHDHPLVVVAAARTLAEAGLLDAETAGRTVASSTGLFQATLAFLALRHATGTDDLLHALAAVIDRSGDSEGLKWIGLATFHMRSLQHTDQVALRYGTLLQKLGAKRPRTDPLSPSDSYLLTLLTRTGVIADPHEVEPMPEERKESPSSLPISTAVILGLALTVLVLLGLRGARKRRSASR